MKISFGLFTFAFILFSVPSYAQDPRSRDAGFALLQNYQCDSKGDVTSRVMDSIKNTKSVVGDIARVEKECASVNDQISQLPTVESIAQGLISNETIKAIRYNEGLIDEALADMAFVSGLQSGDPQLSLYPSMDALQETVRFARAQLIALRSQQKIEEAKLSQTNLVNGITQLDQIAQGYAAALRGSEECFKKRPDMKKHLTSGIIGIAGFFMSGPFGMATSFAGRLMQDIFDISAASKNRVQDSFNTVDQTAIMLGMGCAFEQLGKQHCRIIREKKLFTALSTSSTSTCESVNTTEKLLGKQQNIFEALKKIEEFTSKTSVVASDPSSATLRESAKKSFNNNISTIKTSILNADSTARAGQTYNGNSLSEGLIGGMATFAGMVNPLSNGNNYSNGDMGDSQAGQKLVRGSFTADQQKQDMLMLLAEPGEDPQSLYLQLKEEFQAYDRTRSVQGSTGYLSNPALASAFQMYSQMDNIPSELQGPTTKMLRSRLRSKESPQKILGKLDTVERSLQQSLSSDLTPVQTLSYLNEYFQGQDVLDSSTSPSESLRFIDKQLQEMALTLGDAPDRSGLRSLTDDVHRVALSSTVQEMGETSVVDQKKMIADLNLLVGKDRELYTRLKTVIDSRLSKAGRSLAETTNDSQTSDETKMKALFLLNHDALENTIGFSKNPSAKQSEYDGALALSAAQLEGFSKFSEPYMDYAIKFLSGKDVKGRELSKTMIENASPELKNRFCVQTLSMSELPDDLKKLCKGAILKSGDLKVIFDDVSGLSHQDRSCVYYNFASRERAASQTKVGR